jgi:hypothetical protein
LGIAIAAGEPGIRREGGEIQNVKNKAKVKMGKMARLIGVCDRTRRREMTQTGWDLENVQNKAKVKLSGIVGLKRLG